MGVPEKKHKASSNSMGHGLREVKIWSARNMSGWVIPCAEYPWLTGGHHPKYGKITSQMSWFWGWSFHSFHARKHGYSMTFLIWDEWTCVENGWTMLTHVAPNTWPANWIMFFLCCNRPAAKIGADQMLWWNSKFILKNIKRWWKFAWIGSYRSQKSHCVPEQPPWQGSMHSHSWASGHWKSLGKSSQSEWTSIKISCGWESQVIASTGGEIWILAPWPPPNHPIARTSWPLLNMYIYIQMHMYINIYIYTCTYIYIYVFQYPTNPPSIIIWLANPMIFPGCHA